MLTEKRYELILKLLDEQNSVTVAEIKEKLKISESTIRRDLNALDKAGKLNKVFGGAVAIEAGITTAEPSVAQKKGVNKEEKQLAEENIRKMQIDKLSKRCYRELSGGQQQRVSIARALLTKPAIVLADEPTGNLDSVTSMEVVGLLRSCAARFHQTTLIVTHQEEVAQMADRVIRMSDGKIYTRDCNDC